MSKTKKVQTLSKRPRIHQMSSRTIDSVVAHVFGHKDSTFFIEKGFNRACIASRKSEKTGTPHDVQIQRNDTYFPNPMLLHPILRTDEGGISVEKAKEWCTTEHLQGPTFYTGKL